MLVNLDSDFRRGWLEEPMLRNRFLQHRWTSMSQETDTLAGQASEAMQVSTTGSNLERFAAGAHLLQAHFLVLKKVQACEWIA